MINFICENFGYLFITVIVIYVIYNFLENSND